MTMTGSDPDSNDSSRDCLLLVGEALRLFAHHFRQPLPLAELAREAWGERTLPGALP